MARRKRCAGLRRQCYVNMLGDKFKSRLAEQRYEHGRGQYLLLGVEAVCI
jgi:hypothetical protein